MTEYEEKSLNLLTMIHSEIKKLNGHIDTSLEKAEAEKRIQEKQMAQMTDMMAPLIKAFTPARQ